MTSPDTTRPTPAQDRHDPADHALPSGLDFTGRDEAVRPQDDFYRSWHGRWLAEFEIPADKAEYASFIALHDQSQEQLRDIISELAAELPPTDTPAGKIAASSPLNYSAGLRSPAGLQPSIHLPTRTRWAPTSDAWTVAARAPR